MDSRTSLEPLGPSQTQTNHEKPENSKSWVFKPSPPLGFIKVTYDGPQTDIPFRWGDGPGRFEVARILLVAIIFWA